MFILWLVTIPLIVIGIVYLVRRNHHSDKSTSFNTTSYSIPPIPPSQESNFFIKDWSLLDFALEFGPKMEIGSFTSRDGRPFHVCRFTQEDGTETTVYFFSQLGELSSAEIKERKHELYVGQIESGKYYLHDKNVKAWEEVNLEI